jgi:FdhD protein
MKHLRRKIVKWHIGSEPREEVDDLAAEAPLQIRVQRRGISVTLRTPGHDDELAAGFLLTEGVIKSVDDVVGVIPGGEESIDVVLSPDVHVDFQRLTRHVFTGSSCGLCGKASIEAIRSQFPPVQSNVTIEAATILALPARLRAVQDTFDRTGGLHAAALFDLAGELLVLREDVGRHNAVDKVLGRMLLDRKFPLDRHVLLVSGRASFEILQKSLAAGVAIVAAVSAPSNLATEFAEESGQTLIGFLREGRMNIYAHPKRVKFEP